MLTDNLFFIGAGIFLVVLAVLFFNSLGLAPLINSINPFCIHLLSQLEKHIKETNYCDVAQDCRVLSSGYWHCGIRLLGKKGDYNFAVNVAKQFSVGGSCWDGVFYECLYKAGIVGCQNNKCVLLDYNSVLKPDDCNNVFPQHYKNNCLKYLANKNSDA